MQTALPMKRHLRRTLALALAAALLALSAACGGSPFDEGLLGAVKVEAGDDIHIRTITAVTLGSGAQVERTVELAIADYGPIRGHAVTMGEGLDSACETDAAIHAAESVAADPKVVGVIGTSCSFAAVAALPVISRGNLVMLSPSNTAPSLTSDLQGNASDSNMPGYYRTASNDLYQGLAVARFAWEELGLRNVGVLHDGDPYTRGLAEAFAAAFAESGGATVVMKITRGAPDMTGALTELAEAGPDGLFLPLHGEDGETVLTQLADVPGLQGVTVIGGEALLTTQLLSLPEAAGVYFSSPDLDFDDNVNEATGVSGAQLKAAYQARYGEAATYVFISHAYDATTMLLRAIDNVAVTIEGDLYIDRAALREALTGVSGFRGIIGEISCDGFGDCGTGRLVVRRHPGGAVTEATDMPVVYRFEP